MKNQFRIFERNGVFYQEDTGSGKQRSLKTKDRAHAEKLIQAKNEASRSALLSREIGKAYLSHSDPKMASRTWADVMREAGTNGRASTKERYDRACRDEALNPIRNKPLIDTTAEDLLAVIKEGNKSTNHFLRRLHNAALDYKWIREAILEKKRWPNVHWSDKHGVTGEQHKQIVESEKNPERCRYYQLLWETGASQLDAANLTAENVDWTHRVLTYQRSKLKPDAEPARVSIGPRLEALLKQLPTTGYLFPAIQKTTSSARASEFRRRCKVAKVQGVSLHCYRYGWAERAFEIGYPERFAQANLGHSSKAVHRAYAKGAKVICPPLETFRQGATRLAVGSAASLGIAPSQQIEEMKQTA